MPELTPGSKATDRLRLVRVLGPVGSGTAWLTEQLDLGARVAVEAMLPEVAQRAKRLAERSTSEARETAKVRHPRIVQVLGEGQTANDSASSPLEP